jgi:hypothetical protein
MGAATTTTNAPDMSIQRTPQPQSYTQPPDQHAKSRSASTPEHRPTDTVEVRIAHRDLLYLSVRMLANTSGW